MPSPPRRPSDVIEVDQHFYIRASSSLADDRTRVLLNGDTFAVFDRNGDVQPVGFGQQGVFYQEMRHLSRVQLNICGTRPLLLSSTVRDDNILFAVDLTNPELTLASGESLSRGTLHIYRTKFLSETGCYERITVHSFEEKPVDLELTLDFEADFADIFEVRGQKRSRRGELFAPALEDSALLLAYQGLDGILRSTRIHSDMGQVNVPNQLINIPLRVEPQKEVSFTLTVDCVRSSQKPPAVSYDVKLHDLSRRRSSGPLAHVGITTSDERMNKWIRRSHADLMMMLAPTSFGVYPYAGVPWFSTVFGRDGIITALQLLWLAPEVARGVLSFLAATQATSFDAERDAEPGKILHEMRKGEMAEMKEVPFGRYYGTIDATPLFVVLATAYYERTGDLDFLRKIWPNLLAALDWIDKCGDRDGDGFVEYARYSDSGLVQQGWKDSSDSVFHSDGALAVGPIALCEVQSYVYAAKRGMTLLAKELGDLALSQNLSRQASDLCANFRSRFWSDEISMFVLALDGEKNPCRVRSSNAGHCLFSSIASSIQHSMISDVVLGPAFYSGWGVRTIATTEKRFNPMSYHNGSVWPHDNAFIAWGALRERQKKVPLQILSGLLELSSEVNSQRLPELVCGFARRQGKGPTLYPVACAPQAWAAGAVFMALQACLGLEVCAREKRVYLHYSALPEWLKQVHISDLRIDDACVDLAFERYSEGVGVNIRRRTGDIEIVALH
ncbi:MAG TPA: amylo-alpha-1,6-glucosidase [Acidobacteriaceae bacterium]|nr:amylo-alpha-1,6-glucosidase [Acidobacteriaceae bacterium]